MKKNVHPTFDGLKPGEIHGWLIGAGGDALRPIPKTDRNGNALGYWKPEDVVQRMEEDGGTRASTEHLSALREPYLKEIAGLVGFNYARLTNLDTVSESMRDSRYAHREPVPTDCSWVPAVAALLVLVLRFRPERPRNSRMVASAKSIA
ncbi:MAG TPA: hypothetical protein VJ862_09210 [Rhodanobacteraceae bacterium]|nr:hypothetical protein [Rhodanobacteraceae bacterium]